MKRHSKNGLEWLTFDLLDEIKNLSHAVFTKKIDTAEEHSQHGLNLGLHTQEDPLVLQRNFQLVKSTLGIQTLTTAEQTHSKNIAFITKDSSERIKNCDGFITCTLNQPLLISHADCQCAIFYDKAHNTLANVHSGWRGSVQNIYKETIETMQKAFGSKPKDLLVCIGPSLGPKHAEFIHYKEELPKEFWHFQTEENFFDFWAISKFQLLSCGVLENHIEIAQICTVDHPEDFYSYRTQVKSGSAGPLKAANATIALLK